MDIEQLENELNHNGVLQEFLVTLRLEIGGIKVRKINTDHALKVTINSTAHKPITLANIVDVTKKLSFVLELCPSWNTQFLLEVISAGVEQPIKTFEQFLKAQGQYIYIKTAKLVNDQHEFLGTLVEVDSATQHFKLEYKIKTRICFLQDQYHNIKKVRYAVKF